MSVASVLVVAAHPDDAELGCGGAIRKLVNEGYFVALVDLTRGEMGSRGSSEIRDAEAAEASSILGVTRRVNLDIPDGDVNSSSENVVRLIQQIRSLKPDMMITPAPYERHPDHEASHSLCRRACFMAGLYKVVTTSTDGTEQLPHRPRRMISYQQHFDFPGLPHFYVDITDTFSDKMAAIRAFRSQVFASEAPTGGPDTFISRPGFIEEIEARARYYGGRIGTTYAEAFYAVEPVSVSSISKLF